MLDQGAARRSEERERVAHPERQLRELRKNEKLKQSGSNVTNEMKDEDEKTEEEQEEEETGDGKGV